MMSQVKRPAKPCMALAALLGLALLALPARALSYVDTQKTGSLTVRLAEGEMTAYGADLATNGAVIPVQVFKVANIDQGGTYYLEENSPFAGTSIENRLNAPADWKAEGTSETVYWQTATAELLADVYDAQDLTTPEPAADAGAEGESAGNGVVIPTVAADAQPREAFAAGMTVLELQADGYRIDRQPLATGLYLVVPLTTDTGRYEYTFTPMLVSVPQAPVDGTGDWNYDAGIVLKMEQEERLGQLLIEKTLARYNPAFAGAGFVFEVVATDEDGEQVYHNFFDITFDSAGTKQLLVTGLPVGAAVTVTEVYTGASYTLTAGAAQQTVTVPALSDTAANDAWTQYQGEDENSTGTTAFVQFENDYDGHLNGGVSAHNLYQYQQDVNGWAPQRADAPAAQPAEGGGTQ